MARYVKVAAAQLGPTNEGRAQYYGRITEPVGPRS
jgi:hypothetical protein